MQPHSEVPPDTLTVELQDGGVLVEYLDGREILYRGVPDTVSGAHQTTPGKDSHLLVTDATERSGILVYIDELTTEDEILEDTGVGRVLLSEGDEASVFPGVTVQGGQLRHTISVDHETVDGRVFVFEEDHFEEFSYELVPADSPDR